MTFKVTLLSMAKSLAVVVQLFAVAYAFYTYRLPIDLWQTRRAPTLVGMQQRVPSELDIPRLREIPLSAVELNDPDAFLARQFAVQNTFLDDVDLENGSEFRALLGSVCHGSFQVILSFSDKSYAAIAMNWVAAMNKLQISNYIVVAMDAEVYMSLKSRNITTVLHTSRSVSQLSHGDLWLTRLRYAVLALRLGYEVVLSDADAVWVHSPLVDYPDRFDVIARGGSFPKDLDHAWGRTICMGWIQLRPSARLISLFGTLMNRTVMLRDDQLAINRVLQQLGVQWSRNNEESEFEMLGTLEHPFLRIGVLSQDIIARDCERSTNSTRVWHCLSPKKQRSKEKILRHYGLWVV